MIRAPSLTAIADVGFQIDQASTLPELNAEAPAAGLRYTSSTSFGVRPTLFNASRASPWAELPGGTASFLSLRSASVWIGDPFGTMMFSAAFVWSAPR